MASIDVNKQVLNVSIKKALNYLSTCGRDIVLKNEQRVPIEHLSRGRDVLAILPTCELHRAYLCDERDDVIIRDKLLLFYSGSISHEEYHK